MTKLVRFDSGTVPHQLENNSRTILYATRRFPPRHKEKMHNISAHQLLTLLCKAKSVATKCTFLEQHVPTHLNRCLHSLCKCNGASVSHFVKAENERDQGGVRLVILHSSDHGRHSGKASFHIPLHQRSPGSSQHHKPCVKRHNQ